MRVIRPGQVALHHAGSLGAHMTVVMLDFWYNSAIGVRGRSTLAKNINVRKSKHIASSVNMTVPWLIRYQFYAGKYNICSHSKSIWTKCTHTYFIPIFDVGDFISSVRVPISHNRKYYLGSYLRKTIFFLWTARPYDDYVKSTHLCYFFRIYMYMCVLKLIVLTRIYNNITMNEAQGGSRIYLG